MGDIKVGIIGLDTSHSVEFPRRMNAPDCDARLKVPGLRATTCLRFPSIYQKEEGQDKRQKQLEDWGIKVTTDLNEAVKDCDALMLEINNPSLHLQYFEKCASLGKPIFLDKPFAENLASGKKIVEIAKKNNTKFFTGSSLRFTPMIIDACVKIPKPDFVTVFGSIGGAPDPSIKLPELLVWYGVHTFELLEKAMGKGAISVFTKQDEIGLVSIVQYPDKRRGIVELSNQVWLYGGFLRTKDNKAENFVIEVPYMVHDAVTDILKATKKFFEGGSMPVDIEDSVEILAVQDAAARSLVSGKIETV